MGFPRVSPSLGSLAGLEPATPPPEGFREGVRERRCAAVVNAAKAGARAPTQRSEGAPPARAGAVAGSDVAQGLAAVCGGVRDARGAGRRESRALSR